MQSEEKMFIHCVHCKRLFSGSLFEDHKCEPTGRGVLRAFYLFFLDSLGLIPYFKKVTIVTSKLTYHLSSYGRKRVSG